MFEITKNVAIATQGNKQPEVTNEQILLSLADENRRIMPISDNNIYFPRPEGGDGYLSKTRGITMEQLHASSDIVDRDGNLANGINAYTLIQEVANIANDCHKECVISDLFVADNKNKAQGNGISINERLAKAYQEKTGTKNIPFAATTFNRVFCNITLTRQHTDTHAANIVVVTNQRGLQVAIGANAYACRNQTVLGYSHLVSSYGNGDSRRQNLDLEDFKRRVRLMIQGYRFADDMKIIEQMKRISIDQQTFIKVIGELTAIRVAFDSSIPAVHAMAQGSANCYPMNSSQIQRFAESLMLTYHKNGHRMTVYDMYQSATALYKVASMDMPNILPQNAAFVDYLNDEYNLGI
jgi:hypothetical protein